MGAAYGWWLGGELFEKIGHKKHHVLLEMMSYDHFRQKWRVCDSDCTKWTRMESDYVLVDAGDIHDEVGKLRENQECSRRQILVHRQSGKLIYLYLLTVI